MEDYDYSPELSRWCLVEAMHVHPEAFVEGCGYFCRRPAYYFRKGRRRIGVCERTAKWIVDQSTGEPMVMENKASAECAKDVGRDIIMLVAPEFMDVTEAYYIE